MPFSIWQKVTFGGRWLLCLPAEALSWNLALIGPLHALGYASMDRIREHLSEYNPGYISLYIYIYVDIHVKIDLGIILIDYMDLLLSPSCWKARRASPWTWPSAMSFGFGSAGWGPHSLPLATTGWVLPPPHPLCDSSRICKVWIMIYIYI